MKTYDRKDERRKAVRIDSHKIATNSQLISTETKGSFQFKVWPIKNLSTHGIAISSDENVSQGAMAFLNIDLDILMKTVSVIAQVVWSRKCEQGYEIGLNFCWWPKKDDQGFMLKFIENEITDEEVY